MSAPRALLGATLLLWGVCIGLPWAGVILALAVEAARMIPGAPLASPRRLATIARSCLVLAFIALAYFIVTGRMPQALYAWLRWLPVFFLALPIAQSLAGGSIPLAAFVAALRPGTLPPADSRGIDTTFAFVALTLVAAAAGGRIEAWFYLAAAGIVAWALLARMPRAKWRAGIALIAVGVAAGYGVQRGLWLLQGELEELDYEAITGFFAPRPDPFRERTRIGDLGRIKLNDRIIMRVVPEGPHPEAILLRENAFDHYVGGEWKSSQRNFRALARQGERWTLREGEAPRHLTLRRSIPGGEALLPLPAGWLAIDPLAADTVEVLPTGAVRAKGTPRFVAMRVSYDEGAEHATVAGDLHVPEALVPMLDRVIAEHRLAKASPRETLAAIERFFADRFSYSLDLSNPGNQGSSRTISDFLVRDHKGHCEFFATATTLLLRRAGVPSRYTVGYSAQEYSALERAFVVRHRHAHAWTSALVDGKWVTVDTTPARWADTEGEAARSPFAALLDAFSWAIERVVQWWLAAPAGDFARAFAALALLLMTAGVAIFVRRRWLRRPRAGAAGASSRATLAWNAVEAALARRGHPRERGETVREWVHRLQREATHVAWGEELGALARLYYRVRFDPAEPPGVAEDFARDAQRFLGDGVAGLRAGAARRPP